jgi:pimeloyl-ACP methyl ester carboxylesterase
MMTWADGYVNANGIKVHYYRTGGNGPQVVLNHGATDDGLCWTRVAKELEQDYDLIMFDARGHGLSDSGRGDYRSETRAADLAEAIGALGLDRPVIGGHSLGADVSIYVAAMYPELPRAIFLEDPPVTMPGEPLFGGKMGEMDAKALRLVATVMSLFKTLPGFIGRPLAKRMMPVSPNDEIMPWLDSKKRLSSDFLSSVRNAADVTVVAPFEVLERIRVPSLLIMGDRENGSIVSMEAAREMAKVIPDLEIAHLKGANHDIRRTKFTEYIQALRGFLRRAYSE